jgi:hypothetical protein
MSTTMHIRSERERIVTHHVEKMDGRLASERAASVSKY